MLYHFLYPLHTTFPVLNVFRYITFRAIYASLTAFLICFILGPWVIRHLRGMQVGQYVREDGPQTHLAKAGTPTMGGVLILFAAMISALLWMDLGNYYVWILLLVLAGYGAIGFVDDYLMQVQRRSKGLTVRGKFLLQAVMALFTGILLYLIPDFDTRLTLPFFKNVKQDLGCG